MTYAKWIQKNTIQGSFRAKTRKKSNDFKGLANTSITTNICAESNAESSSYVECSV